jgi:hypothetical protein
MNTKSGSNNLLNRVLDARGGLEHWQKVRIENQYYKITSSLTNPSTKSIES